MSMADDLQTIEAGAGAVALDGAQSTLAAVLSALAAHGDKLLVVEYGGRRVQPGYHVTEVKAGSFVTLDCGSNADAWQETILQVEDIPAADGKTWMSVRKFRGILAEVDRKLRLNGEARLTFEIGPPDAPMQIFDVAGLAIDGDHALLTLGARPAICKPRHRVEQAAATCCAPAASGTACC